MNLLLLSIIFLIILYKSQIKKPYWQPKRIIFGVSQIKIIWSNVLQTANSLFERPLSESSNCAW